MDRGTLHDLNNDLAIAMATLHAVRDGKGAAALENVDAALASLESVATTIAALRDAPVEGKNEAFFNLVVEAAPNAMVLVDERGAIALVNEQTEKLFGYARSELLGRSIEMLVPQRVRAAHPSLRTHFIGTPVARPMGAGRDLFARRKDGSEMPVEIALNPVKVDGGDFVLASIVDITERKRVEEFRLLHAGAQQRAAEVEELNRELASASRFKSQFVATMSHELRTPLNAIIGAAELLAKSDLGQRARSYVDTIDESAEALLSLVSSVLDFSKIEAGKLELRESALDVAAVLEGTVDLLAQLAREKGLAVYTYVDPQIPSVIGDGDRLRQVLLNLVGNAVKFTERGEILVRARFLGSDARGAGVRFEVKDSGIGIESEKLPQLFEPFVQADNSASRRFGGTGLGLSICKRLVALMGGEVGIESTPGSGSLFWFTARFAPAAAQAAMRSLPLRGLAGFVIARDDTFASILLEYMASWGIDARRAGSRCDLREVLESQTTWIALVDEDAASSSDLADAVDAVRAAAVERVIAMGDDGQVRKPVRQSLLFDAIVRASGLGDEPVALASPSTATPDATAHGACVLVAEDNVHLQRLLKLQFDELGIRVAFATDGREAVEAVKSREFAMVFMDCQMPNMDGLTATGAIRSLEAERGGHVPIVAMTANAFAEDRDACLASGMDDYLSKPVRLGDIKAAFDRWSAERVAGA